MSDNTKSLYKQRRHRYVGACCNRKPDRIPVRAIAELPERSVIFHVDKTDIFKAHDILGRNFFSVVVCPISC